MKALIILILTSLTLVLSIQVESKQAYTHYYCGNDYQIYELSENDIENFKKGIEPNSIEFCKILKNRLLKSKLKTGPAIILQGTKAEK